MPPSSSREVLGGFPELSRVGQCCIGSLLRVLEALGLREDTEGCSERRMGACV